MTVFRRRRADQERTTTPPSSTSVDERVPSKATRQTDTPNVQIERAFVTLSSKVDHCLARLDSLESRIDELAELAMNMPSHSDVLEVRLHSAKLAAELARATVELRGEIGLASDEARRAARIARTTDQIDPSLALPADIDLTDVRIAERRNDDSDRPGRSGFSESA